MGVSGCGKTTIAKLLSQQLGIPYFDADDFHSAKNVEKMKNNEPLNDIDRKPWLETLALKTVAWEANGGAILACSALKETYRTILTSKVKTIYWVYLNETYDFIKTRLEQRTGHFMKSSLLKSQFEALEVPQYGLHINIDNTPTKIVNNIISNLKQMKKSDFGLIGLGVMGKSIALNIAEKGYNIVVYNRTVVNEETIVSDFLEENKNFKNIDGYTDIPTFIDSLEQPRKILIMIKAGEAIDQIIDLITPYLSAGDIVIDGGNSHYKDTQRRYTYLENELINFVGCGISGGQEGARKGPSIMPGCTKETYNKIAPILEAIAAKDRNNQPCCTHIGTDGAGHFIKMIHNGIEYVEMQLLAELYALLSVSMNNKEIATIFSNWNASNQSSYLLEITIEILLKKEKDSYLLDLILDKAGNKGTGSWSSKTAFDLGTVNTMMASAVFARYISSFKETRHELSKTINKNSKPLKKTTISVLEKAYNFARIVNHHQGFELMKTASETYNWSLNFSEIARIWTNGCIIRSNFMEELKSVFEKTDSIITYKPYFKTLQKTEKQLNKTIRYGLKSRTPMDTFYTAYNYWISITSENLPANLIQAQRDFFGAHTYQLKNDMTENFYHTNWQKND